MRVQKSSRIFNNLAATAASGNYFESQDLAVILKLLYNQVMKAEGLVKKGLVMG